MMYRTDIQVRFHDTDANGHINNASYAVYSEYNRVDFLEKVAGLKDNLILANLNIDFLKEIAFDDKVSVTLQVKKLGNSSIRLYQEVFANDAIAAKIHSVVVVFDYKTKQAVRINDAVRKILEPYLLSS